MKTYFLIILLIITLTACNSSNDRSWKQMENERIIKRYFSLFNEHKWVEMANMYSEHAEFKDPSFGEGITKQTRKEIIEKYTVLEKIIPNVHDEIIEMYPSGNNHVTVEFIASGTDTEGKTLTLPICVIFTIENGLITKDFTYYDNTSE